MEIAINTNDVSSHWNFYLTCFIVMIVLVILLLCCVNILAVLTMGWDKWQARCSGSSTDQAYKPRRISERRLLLLSLCGGWLGIFLGINLFRHKTIKTSFLWRFYAIGLVWFGLIVWLMIRG